FEISAVPPPLPPTNVFHHFAASYQQTDSNAVVVRTYIDGVLVRNRALPGSLSNAASEVPLVIGGEGVDGAKFRGIIDEIGFFNRVLATSEIASIYTANAPGRCTITGETNTPPPPPPPPTNCVTMGLVSWWAAEGNANDSI